MRAMLTPRLRSFVAVLAWSSLVVTAGVQAQQATTSESEANRDNGTQSQGNRAAGDDQATDLELAYQKEFAFLESQARTLRTRIEAFREQAEGDEAAMERRIARLENRVLETSQQATRLQKELEAAQRNLESNRQNAELLKTTLTQADATFTEHGEPKLTDREGFSERSPQAQVETLFEAGLDMSQRLSSIRETQGEFFLADGTRVDGRVIRVGDIAAFGVSDQGAGALAPAGGGELKVWKESTPETAEALAAGEQPPVLDIFLFESLDTEYTGGTQETVLETIQSGGVIAWIIVGLGGVALLLVLIRVLILQSASASTTKLTRQVTAHVKEGRIDAALEHCNRKGGAVGRVVASALRNRERERAHLEDIISENILHESSHLDRFNASIIVIAAVSPLLGLLGTVTGMISTFDTITQFGTGDPKLLSGGISVALVTTELGLAVAIPTLILGNLLSGWAESIKSSMEEAALRVINVYQDLKDEDERAYRAAMQELGTGHA
jgi:biopolymer transport protein ExbB